MIRRTIALLLVLAAGGCGVRPSGVIDAGPAPELDPAHTAVLYLIRDGLVGPVARPTDRSLSVTETLNLLAGPPPAGVTTQVPAAATPVDLAADPDGTLVLTVRTDADQLSPLAVEQLVCTALARRNLETPAPPGTSVTVTGGGHRRAPQGCRLL